MDHYRYLSNLDLFPEKHVQYLEILKKKYQFEPKVVYDIGACVGHWVKKARMIWPNSKYYLFDGLDEIEFLYTSMMEADIIEEYHIGVLSDNIKTVEWYQNDEHPSGSSYYREIGNSVPFVSKTKKTNTLDNIVNTRKFPLPDMIKIDVQGSEIDLLKGAKDVIKSCIVIIVELQHEQYNSGAYLSNEAKLLIENMGFTCIADKFQNNGPDADYCFVNNKDVGNFLLKNYI